MDKKEKNKKEIIDLTRFIAPENIKYDPEGMYTGVTSETYNGDEYDMPIQDADDL